MNTIQKLGYVAAIIGFFSLAGSVAPNKAKAGTITSDSKAWVNDNVTVDLGVDYRTFDKPATRIESLTRTIIDKPGFATPPNEAVHVPEVAAYIDANGNHIAAIPAYTIPATEGFFTPPTYKNETYNVTVPFKQRSSVYSGTGKASARVGSDVLVSVATQYSNNKFQPQVSGSFKSGSLTGTIGTTLFGSDRPQLFGDVAISPVKNLAAIASFRNGSTGYGLQYQMGDVYGYGQYVPAHNMYGFGFGVELGGKTESLLVTQPVVNQITPPPPPPIKLVCPVGYKEFEGTCVFKLQPPVRNTAPRSPKGFINRARG